MTFNQKLTPKRCADAIGVSAEYIIGEIHDGRLRAHVRTYDSGRRRYRIDAAECSAYIERYWPHKNRRAVLPAEDAPTI